MPVVLLPGAPPHRTSVSHRYKRTLPPSGPMRRSESPFAILPSHHCKLCNNRLLPEYGQHPRLPGTYAPTYGWREIPFAPVETAWSSRSEPALGGSRAGLEKASAAHAWVSTLYGWPTGAHGLDGVRFKTPICLSSLALQDERAVHEIRLDHDVTRRYMAAVNVVLRHS